jgi:membrane protein involved in colicin uptake
VRRLHNEAAKMRRELRVRDERITELERASQNEQERAVADARKETEAQVRAELDTERRADALRVAGAAAQMHDPEDAVHHIDAAQLGDDPAQWAARAKGLVTKLVEERDYYVKAPENGGGGVRGVLSPGGRGQSATGGIPAGEVDDAWLRKAARRR